MGGCLGRRKEWDGGISYQRAGGNTRGVAILIVAAGDEVTDGYLCQLHLSVHFT